MGDVTRMVDVVSVAIGVYPTPKIFFVQKCYFSHISPKFVLIGLQKIGLSVTEDYRRDEKCQFTAKCLAKY